MEEVKISAGWYLAEGRAVQGRVRGRCDHDPGRCRRGARPLTPVYKNGIPSIPAAAAAGEGGVKRHCDAFVPALWPMRRAGPTWSNTATPRPPASRTRAASCSPTDGEGGRCGSRVPHPLLCPVSASAGAMRTCRDDWICWDHWKRIPLARRRAYFRAVAERAPGWLRERRRTPRWMLPGRRAGMTGPVDHGAVPAVRPPEAGRHREGTVTMAPTRKSAILGPDGRAVEVPLLTDEFAPPRPGACAASSWRASHPASPRSGWPPSCEANGAGPRLPHARGRDGGAVHALPPQLQVRRLAFDTIDPQVTTPQGVDAKIVDAVTELVNDPGFRGACSDLQDGVAKGYSVVEPIWDYQRGMLRPVRYKHRDPRFFMFDRVKPLKISGSPAIRTSTAIRSRRRVPHPHALDPLGPAAAQRAGAHGRVGVHRPELHAPGLVGLRRDLRHPIPIAATGRVPPKTTSGPCSGRCARSPTTARRSCPRA